MPKLTQYTFQDVTVPPELITGPLAQVSPLVLKILYKRGCHTAAAMAAALFGNLEWSLSHFHMQGTEQAVALLAKAVTQQKQIIIYQDYDADGCCAGALCLEALRAIGGKAEPYVNDREKDGYGICPHGIDCIIRQYPEAAVILTVDNGIVAHDAVSYAIDRGFSVIVTDHHQPGDALPEADAVIDPKRKDETYPFHELCGTGVAWKLMLALYHAMGKDPAPVRHTLDLVALATVADVVPLTGENRDLVRAGLRLMNAGRRPAFRVMKELFDASEINAHYTIAYQFAPMINSLSRMGEKAQIATDVLIAEDRAFLREKISLMMRLNEARKAETSREEMIARNMLVGQPVPPAIILENDSFQEGIVGIVAGRLKNKYHRPVLIFAPGKPGYLKASCRSIEQFPMKENLDQVSHLLVYYGGHAKAAGLTIRTEDFAAFQTAMLELAACLTPEDFIVTQELDAVLEMNQATVKQIESLKLLEPFGEGNPPLLFGLKYTYDTVRFMGGESQHVKYWNRAHNLSIVEWGGAAKERARQAAGRKRQKAIGTLQLNRYNGMVSPQFVILSRE